MNNYKIFLLAFALGLSACSSGTGTSGSSSGSAGAGKQVTATECVAFYRKHFSMSGLDSKTQEMIAAQSAEDCARWDSIDRDDYECGMAATNEEAYAACGIVLHAERRR